MGDIEIEKQKLHQHKSPISINNISINMLKKLDLMHVFAKNEHI